MPFTVDSKIKDILASPKARTAIDKVFPGLLTDPKLVLLHGLSVRDASKMLPSFMPIILKKLNGLLAGIDDAAPAFDFDEIIDRTDTDSVKYEAARNIPGLPADADLMWIADMDFACPEPVLNAMRARLDRRILGYSDLYSENYFAAVTGWLERRHGWTVDSKSIVFSSGVVQALNVCVEELTRPGDGVLINTPCYMPFYKAITGLGRIPVMSPLHNKNGRFLFDFEDMERQCVGGQVKLFFLCSPHNPTGRVWTEDELRRVGDICFAHDVFVVSDEIHFDLLRAGVRHIPFAKLFPNEVRLLSCTAPSKTFNLAGNQLANLIIPDQALAAAWRETHRCGRPGPLSIPACRAAYDQCEDWLAALREYLDGSFALLARELETRLPLARFTVPEGTYLAWIDLSAYGGDDALCAAITRAGLYIQYADDFVANSAGFVRINIACPRAVLIRAINRLCAALDSKQAGQPEIH